MKMFNVVALLTLLAAPLAAQERVVVTASTATLFASADFDAPNLKEVGKGTVLQVLEHRGDWLRVLSDDRVGFIHAALTESLGAPSGPVATGRAPQPSTSGPPMQQGYMPVNQGQAFQPSLKSASTAKLFAFLITGGGHLYAGETGKGLTLMGISVAAWAIGAGASSSSCDFSGYSVSCSDNLAPLYVGAAVAVGTWIYGIMDAGNAVQRANERATRSFAQPYVGVSPQGQASLGLSLALPHP